MAPIPSDPPEPRCTCGYPNVMASNPSGHQANCPVFKRWFVEHQDPRVVRKVDDRQRHGDARRGKR